MSLHIDVDPIKCEAHGLCAELLPERVTLDARAHAERALASMLLGWRTPG